MESSLMREVGSPELKRKKPNEEEDENRPAIKCPIEVILPDSLIKPIIYESCVIATLGDKQKLSEFIREINKSFPLPTFAHLKRVRSGQVLLFPAATIKAAAATDAVECSANQLDSLSDRVKVHLIEQRFPQSLVDACSAFAVEDLPVVAPQLKSQYAEVMAKWPCKFHEDKALERLSKNENFSAREIVFHQRMMRLCLDLEPIVRSECVAMAFDPARNEIVALGWRPHGDEAELMNIIPSNHSVMRAIDNVASAHGGGAWKGDDLLTGLSFAKDRFEEFKGLHLDRTEELKYGSYLCTGYDFYLTDEPCLMCAMAMVHSRVRRIFFRRNNVQNGALGGGNQLKLHGVRELNHHYQVFRVNEEAT